MHLGEVGMASYCASACRQTRWVCSRRGVDDVRERPKLHQHGAQPKKTARHSTDLEQMYRPHFHPSKMYTLVHYLMYLILWYIICQVLYLAPPAVPTSPPSSAQTSIVTSTALGTPLVGKRPDCAQRRCDASASARRHRREHRSGPESGTSPRPRAAARGPDTASGRNCAPCEATCRALPKPL